MKHTQFIIMISLMIAMEAGTIAGDERRPSKEQSTDQFADVRDLIRTRMVPDRIPSVAVSVAHNGSIMWEEGFGFADQEKQTLATPHTVYRICSVSKVFTGTAIMILVEQGKLDLDRPINDYLGTAKLTARVGMAEHATVRRLANHTSGLPGHDQYFYDGEAYQKSPTDRMDVLIARYGNIVWPPGERHEYSNLGMGVLSRAVSLQSGVTFAEFVDKEVFVPLGMTRSFVGLNDELRRVAAVPYFDAKRVPFVTNSTAAAGDMWSSAHDLAQFAMFHLKDHRPDQKAILSDESVDLLHRTTVEAPGSGYGIAWGTDDNYRGTGYRVVGHHGGNVGWHSFLLLMPSEDLAVAVLANSSSGGFADAVVDKVIGILVPEFEKRRAAVAAKRNRQSQQKATAKPPDRSFKPPVRFVGEWRGTIHTFEGTMESSFWFDEAGGAYAQIGDQRKAELKSVAFIGGRLTADLLATILTADTRRQVPGILEVDLTLRDEELNGVLYANSLFGNAAWGGYRLGHWVELKKVR